MIIAAIGAREGWASGERAAAPERSVPFAIPEEQPVRAELVAEHASVPPNGSTRVGVHFEMEDGWHIYAQDPGDAGLPTKLKWTGPSWVSFGPLHWPQPESFLDPGNIKTSGYSGATVLYSTLQARLSKISQSDLPLPIRARVEWLACKELCIPGSADLELTLHVREEPPSFTPHAELFDHVE
jgi:thiol:disulfide interchange protein DsbD